MATLETIPLVDTPVFENLIAGNEEYMELFQDFGNSFLEEIEEIIDSLNEDIVSIEKVEPVSMEEFTSQN